MGVRFDQFSFDEFALENVRAPKAIPDEGAEVSLERMEKDLERLELETPSFSAIFRNILKTKRANLKITSET